MWSWSRASTGWPARRATCSTLPSVCATWTALGRRLVDEGTSVRAAAKVLRCHHATLYRALDAAVAAGPG